MLNDLGFADGLLGDADYLDKHIGCDGAVAGRARVIQAIERRIQLSQDPRHRVGSAARFNVDAVDGQDQRRGAVDARGDGASDELVGRGIQAVGRVDSDARFSQGVADGFGAGFDARALAIVNEGHGDGAADADMAGRHCPGRQRLMESQRAIHPDLVSCAQRYSRFVEDVSRIIQRSEMLPFFASVADDDSAGQGDGRERVGTGVQAGCRRYGAHGYGANEERQGQCQRAARQQDEQNEQPAAPRQDPAPGWGLVWSWHRAWIHQSHALWQSCGEARQLKANSINLKALVAQL